MVSSFIGYALTELTLFLYIQYSLFNILFSALPFDIVLNELNFITILIIVIFLGIVPTIIGHNAIYYSVKYVSPTIVSAFPLGEPIIATILAFFIFGESIELNIYIGGSITLLGLIFITIKK